MHPALHATLCVLNIFLTEPFRKFDFVDRINRAHEVALVTERHGRIDAHAAFETGIRCGPLFFAGSHALGRHKSLAATARQRVDDIGFWIDAGGEIPNDVIHVVRVGIFADGDDQTRALRSREDRGHEIALPPFFDAIALLDLDDRSAPIRHAVRNVNVHDDAGLHAFAELEHRRFADRRIDVVIVERVHAEWKDNGLAFAFTGRHRGDMKRRRFVRFAHIAGPFGMEVKATLNSGLFRLRGLETAVAWIYIAFEDDFGIG